LKGFADNLDVRFKQEESIPFLKSQAGEKIPKPSE
jgi:hypothetical protein